MASFNDIIYEKSDHVATITINRPQVLNAFTNDTLAEMIDAFHDASIDDSIGVVVLTGAGEKAFSSGGDVRWERDGGIRALHDHFLDFHNAMRLCLKPIIARVNGYAIGGGHHLAYFCDLTVAADHAVFGQNGPRVGSPADSYIVSYLVRVVGAKRAREIWYTCRRYDAQTALDWGLANSVVPMADLDAEVQRYCDDILASSPTCISILKASFEREYDYLREPPFSVQRMIAPRYFLEGEVLEGQNAFLEKRKPDFNKYRVRRDQVAQ